MVLYKVSLPIVVLNLGESASLGTGITISTLLAVDRRLNWDLAFTIISILKQKKYKKENSYISRNVHVKHV